MRSTAAWRPITRRSCNPTTFVTDGGGFLPVMELGDHHALITSGPTDQGTEEIPESEWPHDCGFGSVNAIFPNTVIGGGPLQPDPVLSSVPSR